MCVSWTVQGAAVLPGRTTAVQVQCLRVVSGNQIPHVEPQQPVPGHRQLWWEGEDNRVLTQPPDHQGALPPTCQSWLFLSTIWMCWLRYNYLYECSSYLNAWVKQYNAYVYIHIQMHNVVGYCVRDTCYMCWTLCPQLPGPCIKPHHVEEDHRVWAPGQHQQPQNCECPQFIKTIRL